MIDRTKLQDLTLEELEEVQMRIGRIILNLPLTASLAGHARPGNTAVGNYLRTTPDASRAKKVAMQFVTDVFKLSTDKMLERWYDPEARTRMAMAVGDKLAKGKW
jgi:hypothetical protein